MKDIRYLAMMVITSTLLSSAAAAAPVSCVFDRWEGAADEVVISYLGLSFLGDESNGKLRIDLPKNKSRVEQAEVIRSGKFTGFVFYTKDKDTSGKKDRNRYSFRVYNYGKCEARLDSNGYKPLIAIGRTK